MPCEDKSSVSDELLFASGVIRAVFRLNVAPRRYEMKANRIVLLLSSKTETDLDWRAEEKYRDLGNPLERAGFFVETATSRRNNLINLETQLLGCGAVLAWINPVERNLDIGDFEEMLLRVQASGTYISVDPRVIQQIGTKSALVSMAGTP